MIGRKSDPSSESKTAGAVDDGLRGFDSFELKLGDIMRGERATMGKSLLDVQRELKIKATYIAAIENSDPTAFETKGFIAGYVRSYARYLELDPDWAFRTFCEESAFEGVGNNMEPQKRDKAPAAGSPRPKAKAQPDGLASLGGTRISLAPPPERRVLGQIQPTAVASLAVLLMLIGGLGYGGWSVLQEIQRVELAPVDQAPGVVATLNPLDAAPPTDEVAGLTAPSADALERLYRPRELDLPVMVARDGPIAALDPDTIGTFVPKTQIAAAPPQRSRAIHHPLDEPPAEIVIGSDEVQVIVADIPEVEIFAVRPAWVRVSAQDGTVIFEKILDAGERYALPETEEPARLRAGNSGSVYFTVNGKHFGPAGSGTSIAKGVSLAAADIESTYKIAELPADELPGPRPAVAENSAASQ